MQLIRNCTGEIRVKNTCNRCLIGCVCRAKSCNCNLIGYFVVQKLVIVRDWIISADDDSIAFDFRTPSSVRHITFTCSYSLMLSMTL